MVRAAEVAMRARLDDVLAHVDDRALVCARSSPWVPDSTSAARNGAAAAKLRRAPREAPPRRGTKSGARARPGAGWLRRLWPFLARHRRKVFAAFAVSLGTTLITVAIPLIERAVVDDVIVTPERALWPLLALLIGLGAVNFVLSYIRRFVGGRFAFDVQHDLRTTIFERLQRLDFAHHDQLPTGQIVSRASSDLGLVQVLLQLPAPRDRQRRAARAVARGDARAVAAADAGGARDRPRAALRLAASCAG